jgi:hypothetical protein
MPIVKLIARKYETKRTLEMLSVVDEVSFCLESVSRCSWDEPLVVHHLIQTLEKADLIKEELRKKFHDDMEAIVNKKENV